MESPLFENWLLVMKNELEEQVDKFSQQYNFDFVAEEPIEKPDRQFIWSVHKNGPGWRTLRKCKTGIDGIINENYIKRLNSFTSLVN